MLKLHSQSPHLWHTSFTATGPVSYRVSAAINCSDPASFHASIEGPDPRFTNTCNITQCSLYIPEGYQARVNRSINGSISSVDVADGIFSLIKDMGSFQLGDERINIKQSWVYPVSQVSTCLNPGMAGYWGFMPTLRCVDGTLSGCDPSDGDPDDGTAVRACAVSTLVNGIVDGTLSVVQEAGLVEERPPPANATLTEQEKNEKNEARAVRMSGMAVMVSLGVVGLGMLF